MSVLSKRVKRVKPSATIAVSTLAAELKAQGKDVINLGSGEPDFGTPQHIKDAAIAAMKDGQTRYTPVPGTLALRDSICAKLKRENELEFDKPQIVVTTGAKQAIMNLMQAVIDHDDEAVIIAPCWVSYPDMIGYCGGKAFPITATAENNYKITAEQLDATMTSKTKLVLLNSPSNPSGATYSRQELTQLGEVLANYPDAIICTDEIYEHIVYEQDMACSFGTANPSLIDRTVIVNGVSKAFAMTGWRIGYSASNLELAKAMSKIQSQTTSNACSIAQAAAVAALDGGLDCLVPMRTAFSKRRQRVMEAYKNIDGLVCPPIEGAFYAFAYVQEAINRLHQDGKLSEATDQAFCKYLLEGFGVAAVPGEPFYGKGSFRISFAAADDIIDDALDRIATAFA